jgi:hypothetical protein
MIYCISFLGRKQLSTDFFAISVPASLFFSPFVHTLSVECSAMLDITLYEKSFANTFACDIQRFSSLAKDAY